MMEIINQCSVLREMHAAPYVALLQPIGLSAALIRPVYESHL